MTKITYILQYHDGEGTLEGTPLLHTIEEYIHTYCT